MIKVHFAAPVFVRTWAFLAILSVAVSVARAELSAGTLMVSGASQVNESGFTLSAGSLTIASGITTTTGATLSLVNTGTSYTGATILNGGMLTVGNGTATNTSVVNALDFSGTVTTANVGSGSVIKTGTGTLTLSGTASGTVVGTAAGGITIMSGTPQSNGTTTIPVLNWSVAPGNNITLGTGATLNIGAVSLTKAGTGTLTISGSNTFTGSGSVLNAGTTNLILNQLTPQPAAVTIQSSSFQSGALNLTSGNLLHGVGTLNLISGAVATTTTIPVQVVNQQLYLNNSSGALLNFTSAFPVLLTTAGQTSTFLIPGTSLVIQAATPDYGTPTATAPAATGVPTLLSNRAVAFHGSCLGTADLGPVTVSMEYGPTSSYGYVLPVGLEKMGVRGSNRVFSVVLDGVPPSSTNHYRVKVTQTAPLAGTPAQTFYGADVKFTTAAAIEAGLVWSLGTPVSFDAVAISRAFSVLLVSPFPTTDGQAPKPYLLSFGQGAYGTVTGNGNTLTYTPNSGFVTDDFVPVRIAFSNARPAANGLDPSASTASFHAMVKIVRARLPSAVTGTATVGSNIEVQLGATFAANGPNPKAFFDYGFDTTYGSVAYPISLALSGSNVVQILPSVVLGGLQPGRTYHYRARMTNEVGTGYGADGTFNTPPYVDGSFIIVSHDPLTFDALTRTPAPWPAASASSTATSSSTVVMHNNLPNAVVGAVTQGAHGTVSFNGRDVTYTPGSDYAGEDSFTYTVLDPVLLSVLSGQLPAHVPFAVRVAVRSILGTAGTGPTKGTTIPGTDYSYGSIGGAEAGPFAGTLVSGSKKTPALFAADGSVKLKVGDAAPGLEGSTILKLGAPSGQAALATLKIGPRPHDPFLLGVGGAIFVFSEPLPLAPVTAQNDTVLLGGLDGTPRIAAREGQAIANAPGVNLASFGTFDGNGSIIFFRALLKGLGVTRANDGAVCAALPDGTVRVLVREGSGVTNIATLVGLPGTLAEGRWRAGSDRLGMRLSYSDRSETILTVRVPLSGPEEWTIVHRIEAGASPRVSNTSTENILDGTSDLDLSLPGFGDGGGVAYRLASRLGVGGITAADNVALLSGFSSVLAWKSETAPGTASAFQSFGDPVVGAPGRIAFTATLAGEEVTKANKVGVFFATDGLTPRLIARAGSDAPGGGKFATFTSLVLPDGPTGGPIFTGTLVVDSAFGITKKNNTGLWGVDSNGALQLLIRTVQSASRVVTSFTALTPVAGSIGAAHGYDDAGHVSVLVTYDDRSVSVLKLFVP